MSSVKAITTRKNIFWGSGIACLLAAVFCAISILSVHELSSSLHTLVNHPFKVASAAYNVRFSVSQMALQMHELAPKHEPEDIANTREHIQALHQAVAEDMRYIKGFYLGPAKDVEDLSVTLDSLFRHQENILNQAAGLSIAEIEQHITTQLDHLHQEVYNSVNKRFLYFISGTVNVLYAQASDTLHSNVLLSIMVALLAVVLVTLFLWSLHRRQIEKDHQERVFKIIAENVGNVFLVYDIQHKKVEYISPNSQAVLGLEQATLQQGPRHLLDTCPQQNDAAWDTFFGENTVTSPLMRECSFLMPATGEQRWMSLSLYPVRERGEVVLYVFSCADLTEEKSNQQALRDALTSAQNANNAKSIFLSRMSHEIRTPMNAIIGMTAIAAGALDDTNRLADCLTKIGTSSRHLLLLINDVLDMSRIENGKLTIAHDAFELASVINGMTAIIYPQAKAKGQQFDVVAKTENETLYGDPLRLNQVLLNILSNAVKFTPAGGSIYLCVEELPTREPQRARLRFTISDNGIGMSQEFLDRLFTPFEQEHHDVENCRGGTGLGMSITRNILSLMGGTIRVQSEQEQGTTFVVELDLDVNDKGPQRVPRQLRELRVMVVDDDNVACEHTAIILHRMGIAVERALSGEEAIPLVISAHEQGSGYDVVFMDWDMPGGMDGVEATRRIRQHVGPDTLIIVISAYDWSDIEVEARAAGVNAFISKPIFQSAVYNTLLCVTGGRPHESEEENYENSPPLLKGKRLLLVEDNEINREIALELLKTTQATVDTAQNGQEAVDMVLASAPYTYATVLMDVQMPVMNGHEATKTIRKLPRADAKTLPIIAMTANAFMEDVAAALEAGMQSHISKPVDVQVLYARLREYVL